VRIGGNFQAEVPEWSGPISWYAHTCWIFVL
jgi:hypothetical protein